MTGRGSENTEVAAVNEILRGQNATALGEWRGRVQDSLSPVRVRLSHLCLEGRIDYADLEVLALTMDWRRRRR